MIGTKFYKPLEYDTLTREVMRTVTREVEEQVPYTVERTETRTVQEPVYTTIKAEDGTTHQIVVDYTPKEVTETVRGIEYRTEKKTVTEEVPDSEEYTNPAPNTYTKYREAAQWCNKNNAKMVDCQPNDEYPNGYYEVQAIPEPTAEELAAAELAQAKAERAEAVSKITVTVDGMIFDGDEKAQERMARAVLMAESPDETTEWVLHDNTVAIVSADQLRRACKLAGKAQTALWTVPYEA
jgi:hypothetical protein